MKTMNKLMLLLVLCLTAHAAIAQDSRAYTFSTDTLGDLRKDKNGNAIDFSGVNSVFSPNTVNTNTSIEELPFDVVLLGKVYHNFLIGSSGYVALGNLGNITEPFLFPNNAGTPLCWVAATTTSTKG